MKQTVRVAAFILMYVIAVTAEPVNIDGVWQFTIQLEMGTGRPVVTFKQAGEKITGTYEGRYGKFNLEGTVKEKNVEFSVTMVAEGTTVTGFFSGVFDADKMSGEVEYEGAGEGTWTAVRMPAKH